MIGNSTSERSTVAAATSARRTWFGIDGLITGLNGLAYLLLAGVLVQLLGASATTYWAAGAFLLLFAALVTTYALAAAASAGPGWAIVAVNTIWAAGSLVVALPGALDFSTMGRVWLVTQAGLLGALTIMQGRSLWRR